ncbi:terminase small subunit-like protein [Methylobacterium flocculans]|uniref:terminase small subunit-like protein n=1 Tax=Methylobacterium flocculans TaxID=2984843 RepID=UPI0021F2F1DA|nr:helix-turn-helix domain-containing protein [Methylobacterium sp. FF17]
MSTTEPQATGRPTTFDQATAEAIFEQVVEGKSLTEICRQEAMPHKATVYRWLSQNEEFRREYALATDIRADTLAEDLYRVAETSAPDDTARARLMVDTRKWLLAKMAPRKFGDKITNEHSGPDGGEIPIKVITDHDRAKALAAMIAKTRANAPAS